MKNCWDLKGCPCSHYMNCLAYRENIDCWKINRGCLCHAYYNCEACPIYKKHQEELEQNKHRS